MTNTVFDYRGVIFDVDGTLIRSNIQHAKAWVEALADHDVKVPLTVMRKLIGMGGDKIIPRVVGVEEESALGAKIVKRRAAIFKRDFVGELQPLPGAKQLVETLLMLGKKVGVASSASKGDLEKLLKIIGIAKELHFTVCSDDINQSKPQPDMVLKAIKKIRLPKADLIYVGDTPYDIEAAALAGLRTIAVRSGGWKDQDLTGAIAIYDHPLDILRGGARV